MNKNPNNQEDITQTELKRLLSSKQNIKSKTPTNKEIFSVLNEIKKDIKDIRDFLFEEKIFIDNFKKREKNNQDISIHVNGKEQKEGNIALEQEINHILKSIDYSDIDIDIFEIKEVNMKNKNNDITYKSVTTSGLDRSTILNNIKKATDNIEVLVGKTDF